MTCIVGLMHPIFVPYIAHISFVPHGSTDHHFHFLPASVTWEFRHGRVPSRGNSVISVMMNFRESAQCRPKILCKVDPSRKIRGNVGQEPIMHYIIVNWSSIEKHKGLTTNHLRTQLDPFASKLSNECNATCQKTLMANTDFNYISAWGEVFFSQSDTVLWCLIY